MALHEDEHVLLLEYVYGLLDETDAAKVRDLVDNHPAWREAFAEASRAQELFGKAAQMPATMPLFQIPSDAEPAVPAPAPAADLPASAPFVPTGRRSRWLHWVSVTVAASFLIAGASFFAAYRNGVRYHEEQVAQADQRLTAIDDRLAQLQIEHKQDMASIPQQVARRFVHVNASGPAEIRADVPTAVRVRTADVRGQALPARVTAVLRDGDKEIARKEVASNGVAVIELPAGLPLPADKAEMVVQAETDRGIATVTVSVAVAAPSYTTHLAVNKSYLRTGEILFFRSLTLDRFSMRPPEKEVPLAYALVDAKGRSVSDLTGTAGPGGIGGGEFSLRNNLENGPYTLQVKTGDGQLVASRALEITQPQSPQLLFDRSQYRAGEQVNVDVVAPGYQKTLINLTVDDKAVAPRGAATAGNSVALDRDGKAALQFHLPKNIEFGAGRVVAGFLDNGQNKKLEQVVPVISSRLEVDFFPEGGKLLAGVPNRVYFRVRTPRGEPVAPEGHVILLSSNDIVFDSERNQGAGVFTFTPQVDESYTARVTSPQGTSEISNPFAGIVIERTGLALRAANVVANEGEPVELVVENTGFGRRLLLVATCRDRIVAEQFLDVEAGSNKLAFTPVAGTRGIVRATLYAAETGSLHRLAERLVYRIPQQRLHLAVEQDKKSYRPGDSVRLGLLGKDEKGQPAGGWRSVVVVDEKELGPIDQVAAGLEAYFYLFAELGFPMGAEQALLNFTDGAAARDALDLYLGTRSWRATQLDEPTLVARADAKRDSTSKPLVFSKENANRHELTAELIVQAQHAIDARVAQQRVELEADRTVEECTYDRAAAALAEFRSLPAKYLRIGFGIIALASFAAGCLFLLAGLLCVVMRQRGSLAFIGACACLFVCLVLYGTAGYLPVPDVLAKKAPDPQQWADVAGAGPTQHFAWTGPELPVGKFSSAVTTARMVAASPPPTLASNGANRGSPLDALARYESAAVISMVERQHVLRELGKSGQAAQSDELRRRFVQNLAVQQPGGMGGAMAAPTANSIAEPKSKTTAAEAEKADRQARALEYEHRMMKNAPDMQDTVLWKPLLAAPPGEADLSFDLSQRVTNYRVLVYGNDASGRLGFQQETIVVRPKE